MGLFKTERCILCGRKAVAWHGSINARDKTAAGEAIDIKVVPGWCEQHKKTDSKKYEGMSYNRAKMGSCIPLFR